MTLWLKKWAPFIVLVLLTIAANFAIYQDYLSYLESSPSEDVPGFSNYALEKLHNIREVTHATTMDNPVLSAFLFGIAYAVIVSLSLPFGLIMSLLGGFLFGKFFGTAVIVIGATIGATVIFLIARTSLGKTLRARTGPWYQKVAQNIQDNAVGYLLFLRLVPVFPFFVVNVVPAFFNVSTFVYITTTFFGIIPGAFVYANLGEELGQITKLSDLVSQDVLIAFTLLGVLALLPTLYKNFQRRKASHKIQTSDNGE